MEAAGRPDKVAGMNMITKTHITVEHHCLNLSYASLRVQKRRCVDRLSLSMERAGQLVPVVVVPKETGRWTLIDGYLRVSALRRIGKDIVDAEVWNCGVETALLMLLTTHQSRAWEAFEEALLLHELHTQHGLSQNRLADQIGRDQSWVSRRLSLLDHMPDALLDAVTHEKLSVWGAVRVIGPMARAMPEHAEILLRHVIKHAPSTRELKCFYDHYRRSPRQQRVNMITDPCLFFKAQKLLAAEKAASALQKGPEGRWCFQLTTAHSALASLTPVVSELFAPRQDAQTVAGLLKPLNDTKTQLDLLIQTIRSFTDANERHEADRYQSPPERQQQQDNQPSA